MIDSIDKMYFRQAMGDRIKRETDSDISAKCPVCNDRKARFHMYEKNGMTFLHCFNGGCDMSDSQMRPHTFFRTYYPEIFESYKRETFATNISSLRDRFSEENDLSKISWDLDDLSDPLITETKEEIQKPVQTLDLSPYLVDINNSQETLDYVRSRAITYSEEKYGKWFYAKTDLKIGETTYNTKESVVIPLYYNKKDTSSMYGFYSRKIHQKNFATFNQEVNIGYKIWGWFQIDKKEETLITEGIFDCLTINYQNKIALMGAKIPEERLKELSNPIFVLDNDKTGILNSIEYAKRGFKVYIQPNDYREKDMNELMLNHPNLDIYQMIKENIVSGISGVVRLKMKL